MQVIPIREARASFSALVEAAELGCPTTITRYGRPVAVLVSVADAERLYPTARPSFTDLLFAFPGRADFERDQTPLREVDL